MRFAVGLVLFGWLGMADGVTAYNGGRYAEASETFARAEERAGHGAGPELLFDRALAALRAGDLRVAEYSAEKAVVRGGAEFESLRIFLFANAAFGRSLRAEAEAGLRDADPTAFGRAIDHLGRAIELWRVAAMRNDFHGDWPAARRNLERALRKLEELEKKKEEAEQNQNKKKEKEPEQKQEEPTEDPDAQSEEQERQATPQPEVDLSSAELAQLFERLRAMEREKRELRQERRRVRSADVEKDW
ncbi:MAG: hypothetical protein CMJ89_16490 [Planctomycetes bacterium]|nr:hypothetical protein [Planctomycetota bacterium]